MQKTWWKEAIVYQIYPRSFYDSNDDGIGDLPGIIEKLDHIQHLGVDVIWLGPVYDSPNDDNGYDIRDYYAIMQEFGTMADFDRLLAEVHQRGMKLIMDLVVNHSSDEHAWFVESRSSKTNDKRDFYIWKDSKDGHPPNNWPSFFGGNAWKYHPDTDQWYLHLFTEKQPDLNWENEALRNEVYQLMNWWLDKGIDGFRMDVISVISKRDFDDTPFEVFEETISNKYANGPRIEEFLTEMVEKTTSKYDVMTVGEGPGIDFDHALKYVDESKQRLNMIFHFDHMFMDHGPGGKFDPVPFDFIRFVEVFEQWDKLVEQGGWPAIFLGNHDFARIVSRFGNDQEYHEKSAKALAVLLLTLRGTTYIYQGDEIGMTNIKLPSILDYRDVETLNAYREVEGNGGDLRKFMEGVYAQGRDNARTPMQWSRAEHGGFSKTTPWLNSNPNHSRINVEDQEKDEESILHFYKKAVQLRKSNPTLVYGSFKVQEVAHKELFLYERKDEIENFLVAINFSSKKVSFQSQEKDYHLLMNNYPDLLTTDKVVHLRPWEACVFKEHQVEQSVI